MFDIHFYMKSFEIKRELGQGTLNGQNAFEKFEKIRSEEPFLFNIETTNLCNMSCKMCPGPRKMTRPRVTMPQEMFTSVIDQLRPWSPLEWNEWEDFVERSYHIPKQGMDENHFFLYVIPKVIALHGYGEPLLDPSMVEHVAYLSRKGIPSYFSCNPWNINLDLGRSLFEAGLNYLKFSTDSSDELSIKQIRGKKANFSESYKKMVALINMREQHRYQTTLVITMLNLNRPNQMEEYEKLYEKFKGMDIYIYLKSQDQQWYHNMKAGTQSVHWLEPCQFPWSSMTVKSDGSVTQCIADFNNEIILGHVLEGSLRDIWNGERYKKFREEHLRVKLDIKCTRECDMRLIGQYPS
jgi:radical SAM protein with 4Fe4S-binding SPASM domain